MAAGLTLKLENYKLFSQKINAFALNFINDKVFMPIEYFDQEITEDEINQRFIKELALLEPYGCDNPRPKFKITSSDIEITPLKRTPQHAKINIGKLSLMYFNFVDNLIKINFEPFSTSGTVVEFDGGSFIVEDAYKKLNPIELNQIAILGKGDARYTLYPKTELLEYVSATSHTVFGTCFVTYSCFDYVEFCKQYNTEGIYHFGIYEDNAIGYNTILLSPKGLSWAKNFSKIVFLSPVVDEKFISALNMVTEAEIFIPIEKEGESRKFAGLDNSRETFGKIYKELTKFNGKSIYNVFDIYDKTNLHMQISFFTFYCAMLVFNELGLISVYEDKDLVIKVNKNAKAELTSSRIFGRISLLKETLKGEANKCKNR